MKSRWQSRVQEMRALEREPTVEDVRRLIRMISKERNDPVFGGIMDNVNREQSLQNSRSRRPNAVSVQPNLNFSIQTNDRKSNLTSSNVQCYFCGKNHKVASCEDFKKKTGEEKFNFFRFRKLCDNFLSSFHFSAGCKRKKACTVPGCDLRRKHLTSIHDSVIAYEQRRKDEWKKHMQTDSTQNTENFVGVTRCDDQGRVNNGLPIVPLKVKAIGSDKVFDTYALLGSGSTASFCSEALLNKLDVAGRKCQMSVATISGVNANFQTSVVSLEVMNLEETVNLQIPNVFSTKTMNISISALARQEDVKRWQHLDGITLPDTVPDAEVNLLIGVDVPEALQPEEVRKSADGGCATFALRKIAEDNASLFDDEVIQAVRRNFYVDDLLKAVEDTDKAIAMQKHLGNLLARGGFHLSKWVSNSRYVLETIPECERSKELKNIHLKEDKLPIERALGLKWNVETDKFTFNISAKDQPSTRRGILSTISSIYDLLGFISPYILKAKLILQRLCKDNVGWDEHISGLNLNEWENWLDDLTKLKNFEVTRCYVETGIGNAVVNQLHHFSDASKMGYGVAVAARGEIHWWGLLWLH